jgi:transposase
LLNDHLREYNKRMTQLLAQHPDTVVFQSFPGIAAMIAATFISEMGETRARFPHPGALLAETSLAPVTKSSGRTRQVRFRYAASRRMRHAIDWWMSSSSAKTHGHGKSTISTASTATATTAPCAAYAPAGYASSDAAGPTTPPTTRNVTTPPNR